MRISLILLIVMIIMPAVLFSTAEIAFGQSGGVPGLQNPLGDESTTISAVITNIIVALRDIIAPPIVALAVLYGGFQMLFAGGVPEKFSNGRKTMLYAVVGYVIIIIASGISDVITDVLSRLDLFDSYIA